MARISAARAEPEVRFRSWSASRLDDYERCPFMAKHKHLLKTCPICFKGPLRGGFDSPAVCASCGGTPKKGDALVRGGEIGDALDLYLAGEAADPGSTILHPKVKAIVAKARAEVAKGVGAVQVSLKFDRNWKVLPGAGFDPNAWLYVKLDYRRNLATKAHVTDWKTGGIDKDSGQVKVVDKYDDQLLTYQVATLVTCPKVKEATADLVFLDARPPHDPVLDRPPLVRGALDSAIKKLTKKVLPMFNDTTFAPKAQYACRWCDYAKGRGGPCRF